MTAVADTPRETPQPVRTRGVPRPDRPAEPATQEPRRSLRKVQLGGPDPNLAQAAELLGRIDERRMPEPQPELPDPTALVCRVARAAIEVLRRGKVRRAKLYYLRGRTGKSIGEGMFDYWTVLADGRPEIESYCGAWLRANFRGYTGMVNVETIDAQIIEVHLRFSDQWPDLYGAGWTEALVRLYCDVVCAYEDGERRDGYSVVLFGPHSLHYWHPDRELIDELLKHPDITSIQITFHEDKPPRAHSMPPGGFRLAIINCWELAAGVHARERLALRFWATQQIVPKRPRRKRAVAAAAR
jgi:hypothetical protein